MGLKDLNLFPMEQNSVPKIQGRTNTRHYIPCPALAARHAQPIIRYFAVPFGRPGTFACAIHMYTPVGGKAPSVPLGVSACSP